MVFRMYGVGNKASRRWRVFLAWWFRRGEGWVVTLSGDPSKLQVKTNHWTGSKVAGDQMKTSSKKEEEALNRLYKKQSKKVWI